jgi:hypothetical protein
MFNVPSFFGFKGSISGGGGFDADYQAVLDYATTQGYTLPSAGQQILQNQLVLDLKDGGIWSKLDTFGVFATDGDSDFALIDWIRLTDYTAVNSPTFTTDEGFTSNGTSSYIDINYNPTIDAVNLSLNNASIGFYEFATTIGANGVNAGSDSGVNDILLTQKFVNGNGYLRINDSKISRPSSTNYSNGLVIGQRINSSTLEYYTPAKVLNSYTADSDNLNNVNITFLKFASVYGLSPISIGFLGASFTSSEIDDFYNAVNTYITSL